MSNPVTTVKGSILRVALPIPLRRVFDYLAPEDCDVESLRPGIRVSVPFGNSKKSAGRIGIVLEVLDETNLDKIKSCNEVIDSEPLFSTHQLDLLLWASAYYHHSIGEVLFAAIPTILRQGLPASLPTISVWRLTPEAPANDDPLLKRAAKQAQIIDLLRQYPDGLSANRLSEITSGWRNIVKRMVEKSWLEKIETEINGLPDQNCPRDQQPLLNDNQSAAVEAVNASIGQFQTFLLEGVTGSGKTEVYFRIIEKVISEQAQALVLIPEIGLTVQLIERFRQRFDCPVSILHSGLNDQDRLNGWLLARQGKSAIVIGTRSAVWTPLPNLGVIIVDEEHDASYKQQDGFRYSARDIAIVRAQRENVPIVLGSATPSLESLNNVQQKKCLHLTLPERAGKAVKPLIRLLDIRRAELSSGLSPVLIEKIRDCLHERKQALLFLNRRGFSPVIMCHNCGWIASCRHCDANLTLHQAANQMRCHHCGSQQRLLTNCPDCNGSDLNPVGQGTEQISEALQAIFPDAKTLRIDRDSTSRKGEMDRMLAMIYNNEVDILVGTQMLSKGHHFPNVTLVGVLDADNRLYGTDFRSAERLSQLIIQVAGRAGRAEYPGEVYIQTHHPDHALLQSLAQYNFSGLTQQLMSERSEALLPPFSSMVILRAESNRAGDAMTFLHQAKTQIEIPKTIEIWGPMIAQMERRAGRYRAQMFVQTNQRRQLHQLLDQWIVKIEALKKPAKLRWSVDVDPQDTF